MPLEIVGDNILVDKLDFLQGTHPAGYHWRSASLRSTQWHYDHSSGDLDEVGRVKNWFPAASKAGPVLDSKMGGWVSREREEQGPDISSLLGGRRVDEHDPGGISFIIWVQKAS